MDLKRMHPFLFATAAACFSPVAASDNPDRRLEPSRALSAELGRQLKARLMSAMERSGPIAAIDACHVDAPIIADDLSSSAARVGRTALRVRNPDNAPNPDQQAVMESFATRLAQGDPAPEHFVVREDGSAQYLRAIPMDAPCLTCHGPALSDPVQKRIDALYPDDRATGFAPGELRGAFVVSWPAPN